jgi:hypothetical protein
VNLSEKKIQNGFYSTQNGAIYALKNHNIVFKKILSAEKCAK